MCALLHPGPFVERDVAAVADDVAGETLFLALGQELRGLEELPRQERLGVGAALGLVVAREGEDDDQAEQDREARREHAEDARGPVAVGEVAAFGRASPHEQHYRDCRGGDADGDEGRPEDVHLGRSVRRGDRLSLPLVASSEVGRCFVTVEQLPPADEESMHLLGAENRVVRHRQLGRVKDERPRLRPAEPSVEADQLLERAPFLEHGVVEAPDHDVGHVLEPVGAQKMPRGVGREGCERVLSLHPAVGEVVGAVRAERDRAVLGGPDEDPAHMRVRRAAPGMSRGWRSSISSSVSRRGSSIR